MVGGPGRLTDMLGALTSCSAFLGDVTIFRPERDAGGGDLSLGETGQCGAVSPDREVAGFSGFGSSRAESGAGGCN